MFPWNVFPFSHDMGKTLKQMNPQDIEKYVNDMMANVFPDHLQNLMNNTDFQKNFNATKAANPNQKNKPIESSVFDTHEYVYVRVKITNEEWLKRIKLFYTSNQMIIENVPEENDEHTITLPAIVRKNGASAQYKEGMLEIKIPKKVDTQYSEIDVTEIP